MREQILSTEAIIFALIKNEKDNLFHTQVSGDQSDEEFTEVSTETARGTRFKNGKVEDELNTCNLKLTERNKLKFQGKL